MHQCHFLQQFSGTLDRFGALQSAPAFNVELQRRIFLLEVTNKCAATFIFALIYTKERQHCLPSKLSAFGQDVNPVSYVLAQLLLWLICITAHSCTELLMLIWVASGPC